MYNGEGVACATVGDCYPGLTCRIPKNATDKVCSKHVCEDTTDEDGDGKVGYPTDPGCATLTDDDETDGCPGVGATCPVCGDGNDNDGDGTIDYPNDFGCAAAGGNSEVFCMPETDMSTSRITTFTTTGTTRARPTTCRRRLDDPRGDRHLRGGVDRARGQLALQLPVPVATLRSIPSAAAAGTTRCWSSATSRARPASTATRRGPGTNDSLITMTGVSPARTRSRSTATRQQRRVHAPRKGTVVAADAVQLAAVLRRRERRARVPDRNDVPGHPAQVSAEPPCLSSSQSTKP